MNLCVIALLATIVLLAGRADAATDDGDATLERVTFEHINAVRQDSGLPPLQWDADIARLARQHSCDMASGAVDFGHAGFRQRVDGLKKLEPHYGGAGENVFMTSRPFAADEQAVYAWLHSPGHAANIRGDFNRSGIGVARTSGGSIYFTQLFAKVLEPPPL